MTEPTPLRCVVLVEISGAQPNGETWRARSECGLSVRVDGPCQECGHAECEHDEEQELDLDGRPTSLVYEFCYICLEADDNATHPYRPLLQHVDESGPCQGIENATGSRCRARPGDWGFKDRHEVNPNPPPGPPNPPVHAYVAPPVSDEAAGHPPEIAVKVEGE